MISILSLLWTTLFWHLFGYTFYGVNSKINLSYTLKFCHFSARGSRNIEMDREQKTWLIASSLWSPQTGRGWGRVRGVREPAWVVYVSDKDRKSDALSSYIMHVEVLHDTLVVMTPAWDMRCQLLYQAGSCTLTQWEPPTGLLQTPIRFVSISGHRTLGDSRCEKGKDNIPTSWLSMQGG